LFFGGYSKTRIVIPILNPFSIFQICTLPPFSEAEILSFPVSGQGPFRSGRSGDKAGLYPAL
jgi:hypothetical protein